jgi:hypothetical protein
MFRGEKSANAAKQKEEIKVALTSSLRGNLREPPTQPLSSCPW